MLYYGIACIRKIEPVVQVNNTKYPIPKRLYYMSSAWPRLYYSYYKIDNILPHWKFMDINKQKSKQRN